MLTIKNPLLKQLLGASAGTLTALAVYSIYTFAAPSVSAFLSSVMPDAQTESKFTGSERAERRGEVVERAREIIERQLDR